MKQCLFCLRDIVILDDAVTTYHNIKYKDSGLMFCTEYCADMFWGSAAVDPEIEVWFHGVFCPIETRVCV